MTLRQTALDGAKEAEKTALSELGNAKSAYDTALGNYRTAENNSMKQQATGQFV